MIRIKLASNVGIGMAQMMQSNFRNSRKYPERHPKRERATIQIRKVQSKYLAGRVNVYLIINPRKNVRK